MSQPIHELSAALVREFLSKKGLKSTLAVMDEELPRTAESISSRVTLAKDLCIEGLLKKNKTLPSPYKTMIEVMVKYFVDRKSGHTPSGHLLPSSTDDPPPQTTPTHPPIDRSHTAVSTDVPAKTARNDCHSVAHGNPITYSDDTITKLAIAKPKQSIDPVGGADLAVPSRGEVKLGGVVPSSMGVAVRKPPADARAEALALGSGGRRGKGGHFKARGFAEVDTAGVVGVVRGGVEDREGPASVKAMAAGRGSGTGASGDGSGDAKGVFNNTLLTSKKPPGHVQQSKAESLHSELLCEDLENLDLSYTTNTLEGQIQNGPSFPRGDPISAETAKRLRHLLFGSPKKSFSVEWKRQNLVFSNTPALSYGLVQHKGGPCGVLASIQAYVLKHLMFTIKKHTAAVIPQLSPGELASVLCSAIADILWKVGGCAEATVTLNSQDSGPNVSDPLTDRLAVYRFITKETLHGFISVHLHEFQNDFSSGCILLTVSAVLSRGIDKIRDDMDEKEGTLIGAHGYCTQELVNLLLCGVAVSNVFDGQLVLDSGGAENSILKGIPKQSEIGLLSLFEHYHSCNVGAHYKDPVYPIWVVCSESHFSVLFSPQVDLLTEGQEVGQFDLYYYDGLARQEEVIRLTVDTTKPYKAPHVEDLVPPLELCIRTRWRNAGVNWNGTDPIL